MSSVTPPGWLELADDAHIYLRRGEFFGWSEPRSYRRATRGINRLKLYKRRVVKVIIVTIALWSAVILAEGLDLWISLAFLIFIALITVVEFAFPGEWWHPPSSIRFRENSIAIGRPSGTTTIPYDQVTRYRIEPRTLHNTTFSILSLASASEEWEFPIPDQIDPRMVLRLLDTQVKIAA